MKTYLEYKDAKSQKFWETWSEGNQTMVRYGKIGADGKETAKDYKTEAQAVFEMYKQILAKRKKGYTTPDAITHDELIKKGTTELSAISNDWTYCLDGDYNNAILIEGDLSIDGLDLDELTEHASGLIVTGNLKLDGGICNYNCDYGPFLVVHGDVIADYVIGGGSEINLMGKSYIYTFTVGHYNHGTLALKGFSLFYIDSDHSSNVRIGGIEGIEQNEFNLFDIEGDVEHFVEVYGKKAEFVDVDDNYDDTFHVDIDGINREIIDDKTRLKFLKKLIEA